MIVSFVREQLIDVAAATQTPAAHEALMQLITFTDESAIDYPERFILASAYTTHPGEYLLKGMLVRFTNHSDFFLLFCFNSIFDILVLSLIQPRVLVFYTSWKICIPKHFKYSIQNTTDYMITSNRFPSKLIWFYLLLLGADEEEGAK